MPFDYERHTRSFYQNDRVAEQYHGLFTATGGIKNLPFRVVARRERRTVETLLSAISHENVLDIPAGTGKLAEVFARLGSRVTACDISSNMLEIAKGEYQKIKYRKVDFLIADATDLSRFENIGFDSVVCLRLMHRVPAAVRRQMLREFSRVARYLIVSFGVENTYHRIRRSLRNKMFGGLANNMCFCSLASARSEIEPLFEILREVWIAPLLSRELVFLLKSKAAI
ncbi:MAG TPA: class I SAM-dependent methyltransferase [Rhodanobacteraceae bacterium]|nr:class I SAM-dependent methyltransferase [Rhodanobacteraceae bacterium]